MGIKVEHYDAETGICQLRDEAGRTFSARCEPTGRKKPNEGQKSKREKSNMQTQTYQNAGEELDSKVRHYSAEHHCSYEEGLKAMRELEPELYRAYAFDETPLDREVRQGAAEFGRRVTAYSEHFNISRGEAVKRVGNHDPQMKTYAEDPFGPTRVRGVTEPSPRADVVVSPMAPGEVRPTALMQISVLLGGIPRNADMTISFDAAARVLQAGYLDLLIKAAGEKLDGLARAEIDISGMTGFKSENYPQAFDAARRKYPALTEIYSGGRITMQGLKDLLPHLQLVV